MWLKYHVRISKTDPMVREVDRLEANFYYAHVRFVMDEKRLFQTNILHYSVSNRMSNKTCSNTKLPDYQKQLSPKNTKKLSNVSHDSPPNDNSPTSYKFPVEPIPLSRRFNRVRQPPDRFHF